MKCKKGKEAKLTPFFFFLLLNKSTLFAQVPQDVF